MWKEDGPVESFTAIFYFVAFLPSFSISKSCYERKLFLFSGLYFLLSLAFIMIGLEEISWGQRLFHIGTPELLENYNYQHEMNLHNVKGIPIHKFYIIVGLYGAFSRLLLPKRIKNNNNSVVNLFCPDYFLFFYFFVVGGLYMYYDYFCSILVSLFNEQFGYGWQHIYFMHPKDQEPAEFLLAAGFLLFVMINRYRQIITHTLADKPGREILYD
jgi:hypothetical protein